MHGKFRLRLIFLATAVIFVCLAAWVLWPASVRQSDEPEADPDLLKAASLRHPAPAVSIPQQSETSDPGSPDQALLQMIGKSHEEFSRSPDATTSREILDVLRQSIREAPDELAAAAALASYLKSGKDVSTKLPFEVGAEGVLETAPTLRTALLDLLVTLDPTLALEIARSIMDHTSSPDEYAIALRNLAWNDLNGDLQPELAERFKQLMDQEEWRRAPSAGFLEAFDAAVQLSSPPQFASLLEIAAEGALISNSSLTRASMMALDRMILRNPELLTRQFATDPTLSGIAPKLRASLLSRLDLADPDQQEIFTTYLTATTHGEGELEYFGQLFPNGNYLHGHWMITTPESTPSIAQRAEEDRKVLAQLDQLGLKKTEIQTSQAFVSIKRRLSEITAPPETK